MSNKKFILPYGDSLKDFLTLSILSQADLKNLLRKRGVFFAEAEKINTIPLCIKTGIAPSELEELKEKVKTKEDNPKQQTQSIGWSGEDTTLLSSIQDDLDIHDLTNEPFKNYNIIGTPSFKPIANNPNNIELEFTIERHDLTKSWDKNTTQHTGKVSFKKSSGNKSVNMSFTHTSKETKIVANKIIKAVVKGMKSDGLVQPETQIVKIRFNDFDNASRIKFLKELSQNQKNNSLYFLDTKDIGFKPDNSMQLPDEISWMEDKINNLIIQGQDLHSTFFVKDQQYHPFLQVYRLDTDFSFEFDEVVGECRLSLEFSGFIAQGKNNAEFQINVTKLRITENESGVSHNKIKERLLSSLESDKLLLHQKYKLS